MSESRTKFKWTEHANSAIANENFCDMSKCNHVENIEKPGRTFTLLNQA